MHPSYWLKSGWVARLRCCITTLRFQLLRTHEIIVQAKNSIRNAPASAVLTQLSHQNHNVCTANCHLYSKRKRNGAQRRTKESFGRTMMQALELLQLVKRHILGQSDVEIKPVAIAIIELCLSESIS